MSDVITTSSHFLHAGTSPRFASWPSFLAHLDSLGLFRMKPGLERMDEGIERLKLSPKTMGMIHLVGTNGKGSTAAFVESIARAHGHTTGLFTSPHFITPRERILVNGDFLSEEEWVACANQIYATCPEIDFSYFELLTLMAISAFERAGVNVVIMEAGLGGTWDATSSFAYDLILMAPIGLDHENILGSDLETIARDKAGAITGGHVVCGRQETTVLKIIEERAVGHNAIFHGADDFSPWHDDQPVYICNGSKISLAAEALGLQGMFQQENGLLALRGWTIFTGAKGWPFLPLKCKEGLARVRHPGRMQRIDGSPTFLLDGAHNIMGLKALVKALAGMDFVPQCMIFSCMKDKNILQCLEQVKKLCTGSILIPQITANERAMNAARLADLMGPRAVVCTDMEDALGRVAGQAINVLVCGSLYLLGDFFRHKPDALGMG